MNVLRQIKAVPRTQMIGLTNIQLILLPAILAILLFVIDLLVPPGVAGGVPYVAVVLVALWQPRRRYTLILAAGCSLLVVGGYVFSAPGGIAWMVVTNRLLALCVIWVTATLVTQRQQISRDITERKRAEEALKESEEKFSTAFRAAPDIMTIATLDEGRFVEVNDSFERLSGYRREEVIGRPAQELNIWVRPDDRTRVVEMLQAEGQVRNLEFDMLRKSGEVRQCEFSADIVYVEGVACVLALTKDITERKRAQEELVQVKEHAEEMNRLKTALLANMSHEIRTPLAAIIGFASILAQEVPEQQREPARHIEESGQRLLHTLNAVLDLSMLEAGSLSLNSELINVADEVQQRVALLRPLAEQKGLPLRVLAPAVEVKARLDRAGLDRVLHHLVGNAIKFTKRGEVVVEVRPVAGRVEIRVVDTGVGMSADFLRRLFEAFKQESTGTARLYEGAGLGLTITKRLVSLMEGTITAESKKGRGSTFTVSFPRVVSTAMTREGTTRPATARSGSAPPATGQVPARVLAVDDNPSMLLLLKRHLEQYAVDTARNEETALTLARQHLYDAVLLDINLGGARDGVDVLRELRMVPNYERVPAVAVTAYSMPGDEERFLAAGFDAYLGKPFTEEELHDVLARVTIPAKG